MLKKVLTGTGIAAVLTTVFLLGSLFVGTVSADSPNDGLAEAEVEEADLDDVEEEVEEENEDEDDIDDADDVDNQVEQDGEFDGEF